MLVVENGTFESRCNVRGPQSSGMRAHSELQPVHRLMDPCQYLSALELDADFLVMNDRGGREARGVVYKRVQS